MQEIEPSVKKFIEESLIKSLPESLGIPGNGWRYMRLNQQQNILEEWTKICTFMRDVEMSDNIPEFQNPQKEIKFINYGDTELVYVISVGEKKYTMLVKQPAVPSGAVKQEYENLKRLYKNNKDKVISPICYCKDEENGCELYVTPYIYQARCIASNDNGWGVYVPEPYYYFRTFSEEERVRVNTSMIALLIQLYDEKRKLGISACHLGGGDFILEKGYEEKELTYENILKQMKLIAARDSIEIELKDYIQLIRKEFIQCTYYKSEEERDKSILINHKSRHPMTVEEIETGIELGMTIRKLNEKCKE